MVESASASALCALFGIVARPISGTVNATTALQVTANTPLEVKYYRAGPLFYPLALLTTFSFVYVCFLVYSAFSGLGVYISALVERKNINPELLPTSGSLSIVILFFLLLFLLCFALTICFGLVTPGGASLVIPPKRGFMSVVFRLVLLPSGGS